MLDARANVNEAQLVGKGRPYLDVFPPVETHMKPDPYDDDSNDDFGKPTNSSKWQEKQSTYITCLRRNDVDNIVAYCDWISSHFRRQTVRIPKLIVSSLCPSCNREYDLVNPLAGYLARLRQDFMSSLHMNELLTKPAWFFTMGNGEAGMIAAFGPPFTKF